ncbi:hypothetical protein EDB92DRAFT_1820590 [Lactarius akahatsu]|uniref:DUF6532 domain-containing protein n=1 Tax=Lactarius akahatsu TaxID=416441 RepID=A0AAD4L6Q9_9AGAM|nr:hypothetical protein EDB92DRAFT_1820590 [Lactarius akahatsu]
MQTKLSSTASSYYPGCGDPGCKHGTHNVPLPDPYGGDNDTDDHIKTEEDWMGDELIAKLTLGSTSKFSEAIARERPSWKGLDSIAESILGDQSSGAHAGNTLGSASASGHVVSVGTTPLLPESESREATAGQELSASNRRHSAWWFKRIPKGIEPLPIDAIEHMQAHLVLINAFPDPGATLAFACDSLMTAVEDHQPDTRFLCQQFQDDIEYFTLLIPVISWIRSEVKERCNAICVPKIYAIGPQMEITRIIQGQLSNYNYTFPYALIGIAPDGILRRVQLYQNAHIILVIQDLYFTGGGSSLAT